MSSPPGIPPYIVTFGPQANCTLEICPIQYSLYGYRPSLAANASFIGLFGLAGLVHIWLGIQSKTWFFMGAMSVGCVSALLGYVGRVMMYYNPFNFNAFMLQISKFLLITIQVHSGRGGRVLIKNSSRYNHPHLFLCRDIRDPRFHH